MENNLNNRALALSWWRSLTIDEQFDMAKKYHPSWHFNLVSASSSMIERMWEKEVLMNSQLN